MKKALLMICFILVALFAACGTKTPPAKAPSPSIAATVAAPSPAPAPAVTTSPAPSPSPSPAPSVRTAVAGISPTTGLPSDKDFKPVGVIIENSESARPQTGMQAADIVYEGLTEGSVTRFFCIYNDNMPKTAGPIRSLRLYFLYMQQEWDSILVHFGGPQSGKANVYTDEAKHLKIRIDGLGGQEDYFWRSSDRSAPHNAYTDVERIYKLYNYTPKARSTWLFSADSAYKPEEPYVKKIYLPFLSSDNFLTYTYDKKNDVFLRFMSNKKFTDAATKKQIAVKNLVVQYVGLYSLNEPKSRRMVVVVGKGKAEYFIGGKHVTGTWERADLNSQTVYRDDTGAEIVFRPGKTWIEMHPDTKAIKVDYEKG